MYVFPIAAIKKNNLSLSVKTTQTYYIIALAVKKSEMSLSGLQSRCLLETVRDNLFVFFFFFFFFLTTSS